MQPRVLSGPQCGDNGTWRTWPLLLQWEPPLIPTSIHFIYWEGNRVTLYTRTHARIYIHVFLLLRWVQVGSIYTVCLLTPCTKKKVTWPHLHWLTKMHYLFYSCENKQTTLPWGSFRGLDLAKGFSSWELTVHSSPQRAAQQHRLGGWTSAMTGIFIPRKSATATQQAFFPSERHRFNIYQTTAGQSTKESACTLWKYQCHERQTARRKWSMLKETKESWQLGACISIGSWTGNIFCSQRYYGNNF